MAPSLFSSHTGITPLTRGKNSGLAERFGPQKRTRAVVEFLGLGQNSLEIWHPDGFEFRIVAQHLAGLYSASRDAPGLEPGTD